MKKWKRAILVIVIIVCSTHILLWVTHKTYLYKVAIYNFAGIDDYKLFHQRKIEKSYHPEPWPLSTHYNRISLSPDFLKELENIQTIAFLIIKNDSIYYEKYSDGYSDHSISNSFSVAKSVVSTLIGIAIDDGKIKSVDQPIADFLPSFKEGNKSNITIKHLLTMSSGLDWSESYINPFSSVTEAYYGDDLQKLVLHLKPEEKSGQRFSYKSGDTQLLSLVLEKATGESVSSYMQKKLWQPLGAEQDAQWSTDHLNGNEKAYCCLFTNARDFARLGSLYLHKGKWHNQQILSESYIQEALTPASSLVDESNKPISYYGYQWWLLPDYKKDSIFYARGILGQYIIVIPSKQVVIVRLGKKRGEKAGNHYKEVFDIIDEMYRIF